MGDCECVVCVDVGRVCECCNGFFVLGFVFVVVFFGWYCEGKCVSEWGYVLLFELLEWYCVLV